jgi:ComF family protein
MKYFRDLWDDFISLLFPRLCHGCGEHLMRNEKLICTGCYVLIPRTNFHLEEDNPVARLFWGRCRLEKAAAFSFYNRGSRIRNMIHSLKYRGNKEIGFELGNIYGSVLNRSGFLGGIDIIIPVPLHASKRRLRGFNQSEVISEGIGKASGLPVDTASVRRRELTDTQTRKSRYERWENVEGIFEVAAPEKLRGKHILLVDDVITTGSTIESIAGELLKIDGVMVSAAAIAYSAS